jgi:hypothetical protein
MRRGTVKVENLPVRQEFVPILLLVSYTISDLNTSSFELRLQLHLFFAFWLPTPWVILHSSPFLEPPIPFKTFNSFTRYSPYANVNRANISLALLLSFTQNLMFILCSRLSLIFLPTVYHGQALLPPLLWNEQLIWSAAHVNASWNMSKHVWVHEFTWLNAPAPCYNHSGN